MKTKPQGKGIVKALHQKGTTGNFKKIEKAKGKGAAIGALQNKLAGIRGQKAPYGGKHKAMRKMYKKYGLDMKKAKPGDLKMAFEKKMHRKAHGKFKSAHRMTDAC